LPLRRRSEINDREVRRRLALPAALAALALLAAGASTAAAPKKGGTYRVGWESAFGFTDNLDPTGEC
jgi:ABC-type proline/glycine betaine transport system substrate-binding protein